MARNLFVAMTLLFAVSSAAPYDTYRDFYMNVYDSFENTSNELSSTCLPSATQYDIRDSIDNIFNGSDGNLFLSGLLTFARQMTNIYADCRLHVIPYSVYTEWNHNREFMYTRFVLNFSTILENLMTVVGN